MSNKTYWTIVVLMLAITLFNISRSNEYGMIIWDAIVLIPLSAYQFFLRNKK